jgi:hypothetical protein
MGETMFPNLAPAAGDVMEMLRELEDNHQIQHALCHDLEAIADALPTAPSPSQLRRIGERIGRISTEHHAHAVALLHALPPACRPSEGELAMLETMQSIDAIHGDDLITALWNYVEAGPDRREGGLGYMLRCYFDGARRAMAFKEALVARATRAAFDPAVNADGPPRTASRD